MIRPTLRMYGALLAALVLMVALGMTKAREVIAETAFDTSAWGLLLALLMLAAVDAWRVTRLPILEVPRDPLPYLLYRLFPERVHEHEAERGDIWISSPLGLWVQRRASTTTEGARALPEARPTSSIEDRPLLLMLDCSRAMRNDDNDSSTFDHALDACLLLSQLALQQGQSVGFSTLASDTPLWLAPQRGPGQFTALLRAVRDLHPSLQSADYASAVRQVLERQRRQARVILVTASDPRDPTLLQAATQIGQHHPLLLASLRDPQRDRLERSPVRSARQALDYCAAIERAQLRDRHTVALRAQGGARTQGAALIDVLPGDLGAALIRRYQTWQQTGRL